MSKFMDDQLVKNQYVNFCKLFEHIKNNEAFSTYDKLCKLNELIVSNEKIVDTIDIYTKLFISNYEIDKAFNSDNDNKLSFFLYHDFKIPKRELTLITAFTSHGKTALAVDIATKMHLDGIKTAFITCELDRKDIRKKQLFNINDRYISNFSQKDFPYLVKKDGFNIFDTTILNFFDLTSLKELIEQLIKNKYEAIFIDYIQLIDKLDSDIKNPLRVYLKEIASYLQKTSKKNDLYIIATAQTNKEASKKYSELNITNIAESTDIVRNAGYILGLFKWSLNKVFCFNSDEKKEYGKLNDAIEIITKEDSYSNFIYIKELKTRESPIKPDFRICEFNYGKCKLLKSHKIFEMPLAQNNDSNDEYLI